MGQVLFAPALAGCTSDDVTASAAQVLSGYTALTKDSNDDPISGTMTNRGAWTSGSSGSGHITIPAGYHNGSGYVDCSGAYNAGVTAADARVNTSSANYKAGYNSGRSQGQADVKANPGSYGLESGGSYSNGYNAGKAAGTISIPKLWCRADGDNRCAEGDYNISISGRSKLYFTYTSSYGFNRFNVYIDGNRIGGTELGWRTTSISGSTLRFDFEVKAGTGFAWGEIDNISIS